MIDTVILTLPIRESELRLRDEAGMPAWNLQGRKPAYDTYTKEPHPEEIEAGLYFPKVTAFRRRTVNGLVDSSIRVEFSAPKLIFGNNVEELSDGQFGEVVKALNDRLQRMGLMVNVDELCNASVRAVHYSRNIELYGGYSANYVIAEIGKVNLSLRFDISRVKYLNDGQSLGIYARSSSFVIYDKVADLMRGKGKAVDISQTQKETKLAEAIKGKDTLRLEVRLSEKRKMNSVFRKLGFTENPTFREVFSVDNSNAVLNHYWNLVVAGNGHILFAHSPTPKDILRSLLLATPGIGAKQAIFLVGLLLLIRDGHGIRELRTILSQYVDDRTWYRLATEIKGTEANMTTLEPRGWYGQITSALTTYKPLRIGSKA